MKNKELISYSLIYVTISISLVCISETIFSKVGIAKSGVSVHILPGANLRVKIAEGKPISLSDIPGISSIKMPGSLKNILGNIAISDLKIIGNQDLFIIDGNAYISGQKVDVRLRIAKKGISKSDEMNILQEIAEQNEGEQAKLVDEGGTAGPSESYTWSLIITIPVKFKLSAISSAFKPMDLEIKKGIFALSTKAFEDPDWGMIGEGVTFGGRFKVDGTIKKILNMVGTNLNEIELTGSITPNLVGSSLNAEIPGRIRFGTTAETTGLTLALVITDQGADLLLRTGLKVNLKRPLIFITEINVGTTKASLSGWMEGMIKMPHIPLKIGEFKTKATIDYVAAAASGGLLSLSGLGFGGIINVSGKIIDLNLYLETQDFLASGEFRGGITLKDLLALFSQVIDTAANKKIGFFNKIKSGIPNIGLSKAKVYIAPKDIRFGGKYYNKGIEISADGKLFSANVNFISKINDEGFEAQGYMQKIKLGPITLSGSGPDKKKGTKDDGAQVTIKVKFPDLFDPSQLSSLEEILKKLKLQATIDGSLEIDALGGASASVIIDLQPTRAIFEVDIDIFKKFEANIKGNIKITDPSKGSLHVLLKQTALNELARLLKQSVGPIKKAGENIKKQRKVAEKKLKQANERAHQALQSAQKQAADELQKAQAKVKSAQSTLKNTEGHLRRQRGKFSNLSSEKARLEKQVRECGGKI